MIANIYLLLFLGLFLGGETVLVPAVYFALNGTLDLVTLLAVSIVATLISDSLWYVFGRVAKFDRVARWPIVRRQAGAIMKVSEVFRAHSLKILFGSKFVYGTRVAVQILSGTYAVPFLRYLLVNIVGVLVLQGYIIGLALSLDRGLGEVKGFLYGTEVLFALFVILLVTLHLWIHKAVKKLWFQR